MSAFLDAATLTDLRLLDESAMPDTCTIYSAANPRVVVYTNLPCRVAASIAPFSFASPDRPEVIGQWTIALPVGTDLAPGWQVRMASDTASVGLRGRIFAVTGDLASSYETSRRVSASEAQ